MHFVLNVSLQMPLMLNCHRCTVSIKTWAEGSVMPLVGGMVLCNDDNWEWDENSIAHLVDNTVIGHFLDYKFVFCF